MRLLLFILPFVFLTACERGDPMKRIIESCQKEFGTQGQTAVDKCVRWAVAPPSGNPEKDQPRPWRPGIREAISHNMSMAKHPKRPRDFSQAAKLVVDIASGQAEDRHIRDEESCDSPGGHFAARRSKFPARLNKFPVRRELIPCFIL
jgi:hypothetical protein